MDKKDHQRFMQPGNAGLEGKTKAVGAVCNHWTGNGIRSTILLFFLLLICMPNLSAQTYIRAAEEPVSNIGPYSATLVSSSQLSNYRFYNPFLISNVNPAGDQFAYNESTNTLSFYIERMGLTHSREKKLYVILNNIEVDFVETNIIKSDYYETHIVRDYELITPPDHSIYSVLPSFNPRMQMKSKGYNLGTSDWRYGVGIELRLQDEPDDDFLLTIMAVNPNQYRRLGEELFQHFALPARFLGRVLGESRYSDYVSFVNFHFEGMPKPGCIVEGPDGYTYTLTEHKYTVPGDDLNQAVRNEFGNNAVIADWEDIKRYFGNDVAAFLDGICAYSGSDTGTSSHFLQRNGRAMHSGRRHYLMRRFDGNVRSGWAVHDHIQNRTLCLGSWHGTRKVLVKYPTR